MPSPELEMERDGPRAPARSVAIARRSVIGWVLYDLAASAFSLNVTALHLPLWVREQTGPERADEVYGTTVAIAMTIAFVSSPFLGAITDGARRRLPFLITAMLLVVGFTASLGQGGLVVTLALFGAAIVAFQAGSQFYDALLVEVSTASNRGKVGGFGVAAGYFGAMLGIGGGLAMREGLGLSRVAVFQATAIFFLVIALPALLGIRERGNPHAPRFRLDVAADAARRVVTTLRHARSHPGLVRFLASRALYADAINTMMVVTGLYVTNLAAARGVDPREAESSAQLALVITIPFAIAGAVIWGRVVDRIGPRRSLGIALYGWVAVFVVAACVGLFRWPLGVFYVVIAAAGLCLGGTWAADRPLLLRLTPPGRVGEFFGLYGMVGRFSAVLGPLVWGLIVGRVFRGRPEVGQPVAVLVLALQAVVSRALLVRVPEGRAA